MDVHHLEQMQEYDITYRGIGGRNALIAVRRADDPLAPEGAPAIADSIRAGVVVPAG
jgi:hypothetical protein